MWAINLDNQNNSFLKNFGRNLIDQKISNLIVEKNPVDIVFVPAKFRTVEMYEKAFITEPTLIRQLINNVELNLFEDFWLQLVQKKPDAIFSIPDYIKNEQIISTALSQDGLLLDRIPEQELSKNPQFYTIAIKQTGRALMCVNRSRVTEDLILLALKNDYFVFDRLPEKFKNTEFLTKVVQKESRAIENIPLNFLEKLTKSNGLEPQIKLKIQKEIDCITKVKNRFLTEQQTDLNWNLQTVQQSFDNFQANQLDLVQNYKLIV